MEGADLTDYELGYEPARRPSPSGLLWTLRRRTPLNVESSLVGRPTGWPGPESGPESGCGSAPHVQRAASPESG
jgi:hypothetical protein